MSENRWSYENYRKLLGDKPNDRLWGIVLHDLRNPLNTILIDMAILDEDRPDISTHVKEILETLNELKVASQKLVNVISAIEAHIIDTHQSDSIT